MKHTFLGSIFVQNVYFQVNEGYTLPSELAEVFPQPFTDFYVKNFDTRCSGTDEMTRLVIGNLKDTLRIYSLFIMYGMLAQKPLGIR